MKHRRTFIGILLLASLLANGLVRQAAYRQRLAATTAAQGAVAPNASFGNMDSFALALLLGGLRGPLVMALWTTSESQKVDGNLDDFDTKVEWIRLLQPEFDSVHIFQIWNKAYNISIRMASLSNKYTTILDALDYAQRVDHQRPADLNIIAAIAGVYSDKLGGSQEKQYYRRRVRDETKARPADRDNHLGAGWRRRQLDPLLDTAGMLLPTDGTGPLKPFESLKPYQPFRDGVSPFAIAFDYYKRSQILVRTYNQQHVQLSSVILESRPALALENWAQEEWERGRGYELTALGMPIPEERLDREIPSAAVKLDHPIADPAALDDAIHTYALMARLSADARDEFRLHIKRHLQSEITYRSHVSYVDCLHYLALADQAYLQALANPAQRAAFAATARQNYLTAIDRINRHLLDYYVEDMLVPYIFPAGFDKNSIRKEPSEKGYLHPDQYPLILQKVMPQLSKLGLGSMYNEQWGEYTQYLRRAHARLNALPQ